MDVPVVTEKQAIAKTQQVVKNWPADRLRGKNSAHRAKSATEFKEARMETKKRKFLALQNFLRDVLDIDTFYAKLYRIQGTSYYPLLDVYYTLRTSPPSPSLHGWR